MPVHSGQDRRGGQSLTNRPPSLFGLRAEVDGFAHHLLLASVPANSWLSSHRFAFLFRPLL